ncbi:ABC transporter substrate-binding protein [Photobacterium phosphoreum]|jgi:zinc transport system substrate-binding protein|uniref:High-affinity zinc uptake system protein ZnuA n=1 Tax=Photobacterium phosphoreum TaxID=659 RepID=A0AAW4ZTU7_PHOPO|nr:zinc ABC transporter substrate-binding protein [Photobacterium phosphoreum]MCD9471633.1 ABC transporter substrate-binding protein [Photobacterium phosphoreum]MCD9475253.1 ABC transporter substrate-binding protein [Photobacterium phosphoreum]MCD9478541.1 ABC transporter substrate-binding protein [Photobacterium phosphoreum]MCD9483548.1 ABC transporter substrate-binding protein [Photobacterium phosphoreum]MCD9491639.1 ABC transporter substrate-binding protein [Photobacterium phosphoreum]
MKIVIQTALTAVALFVSFSSVAAEKLTIGITLQPYYSYVKAVVGDKADILPLVDAGFNPHNYLPQPNDLRRLKQMDVIVVNGVGHDDFALKVIDAANRDDLVVIKANNDVPLLPAMGQSVGDGAVNPHTFVGLSTTIQKVYTLANKLAELDPNNAREYRKNARDYAKKFRLMKRKAMLTLGDLDTSGMKVATTHNAYGYLLQEFGVDVAAVIEPAHGVEPSASQLQETIEKIKQSGIDVLFYELNMPNRYVDTIEKATGVKLYRFSHMTHGQYEADKVEIEMQQNLVTLVEAMQFAASKDQA